MLGKFFYILSFFKSKNIFLIIFYSFILILMEIISIALLFPLLILIFDQDHQLILKLSDYFYKYDLIFINFFISFCIFLLIVYFSRFVISSYFFFIITDYRASIQKFFSNRALEYFFDKDYKDFKNQNSNEFSVLVSRETEKFSNSIDALIKILIDGSLIIFILLFLLYQNFLVSLYLSIIAIFLLFSIKFYIRPYLAKWGIDHVSNDIKRMTTLSEIFSLIREIKIFKKNKIFKKKYSFNNSRTQIAQRNRIFLNLFVRNGLEFLVAATIIFTFVFVEFKSYSLSLLLPTISFFFISLLRILPSFLRIITSIQTLIFSRNSINFHLKVCSHIFKRPQNLKIDKKNLLKIKKNQNELKLKNLSFSYKRNKILKNINVRFKENNIIGIIGKSGSGKTTFIELIMSLLIPTRGSILFNNNNIQKSFLQWRSLLSYVSQDNNLLNATIYQNIAFDYNVTKQDKIQIKNLLKKLNYKFYLKFKYRLNKLINFDAKNLSLGERQRISIARGLFKGKKVIILDEISSSLDQINEEQILNEIKEFKKNKIIIIISHKKSALKICDHIYKLENLKLKKINYA